MHVLKGLSTGYGNKCTCPDHKDSFTDRDVSQEADGGKAVLQNPGQREHVQEESC